MSVRPYVRPSVYAGRLALTALKGTKKGIKKNQRTYDIK